jgi:hypothetical protein
MSAFNYIAVDRGGLVAGHSELTEYSFNYPLAKFDRAVARSQSTAVSLSGVRATTFHNIEHRLTVATAPENDPEMLAQMREFLQSIVAGESFTIDAYGTVLTPQSPQTYVLDGNYSEKLVDFSGFYSFSFGVVQV